MPCSNAAKAQNPLKFVGVPQTPEPISAVSGPKFTILTGRVEDVLLLNKFFPIVDRCLSCEDIARETCAMVHRWTQSELCTWQNSVRGQESGLSANLGCMSEMCGTRLAANRGRKKVAKNRHLGIIAQLCRAISSQLRHVSTIGKKLVKQQYLLYMS